jgi:UDPglucose 6-dehydrogenase
MPSARARAATLVPGLQIAEDPYDALVGADAAILVTEWREFLDLDWSAAADVMRRRVVIDGRNQLPGARLAEAGFTYASFGRGTLEPAPIDTAQVTAPVGMSLGWGEG